MAPDSGSSLPDSGSSLPDSGSSPTTGGRVVVVGSVNVDLVVSGPRLPRPGETVTGGRFGRFHGGKGGNQAVAAARLGAAVVLVAAVGDDAHGEAAREALAAAGVGIETVVVVPGTPTGVAAILVGAGGENLISVAGGANDALEPELATAALAELGLTARDVVLASHEIPTLTIRAALAAARAAGATTILNPAPAPGLDRATILHADVLTPNAGELAALLDAEGVQIGRPARVAALPRDTGLVAGASRLLESSPEGAGVARAVVVSLGADGAVLVRRGVAPLAVPAPAVTAVDAVGAGDALNGALAAALAAGLDLETAVRRGVVAGSLAVARAGAREAMPTASELDAALP